MGKKLTWILALGFFISFLFIYERTQPPFRDIENYKYAFDRIVSGEYYPIEPTYYLLSYVAEWLSLGPDFIFFVYSSATLFFMFALWRRFGLGFALLYGTFGALLHFYAQLRIGAALSLAMYAYVFIQSRRWRFLIYGCAVLIHFSVVILLGAFVFVSVRRRLKLNWLVTVALIFASAMAIRYLFGMYLGGVERYGEYARQDLTFRFSLLYVAAVSFVAVFFSRRSPFCREMCEILIIGYLYYLFLYDYVTISARVREMFIIPECYVISRIRLSQLPRAIVIIAFCVFNIYIAFFSEYRVFDVLAG